MQTTYLERHPLVKDVIGIIIFIVCVLVGTLLINTFVLRSFNVEGPSMEKTMVTGDRLVVDRIPVTWAQLQGKDYLPARGQVIVFKNPKYSPGIGEEYIVKRVIAFAGERVVLKEGEFTVYNKEHPNGFNPDDDNHGEPGSPTSGAVDETVIDGTIFVSGDHRQDAFSFDSRNGMGTIPLYDVVGPVKIRVYPFDKIRFF